MSTDPGTAMGEAGGPAGNDVGPSIVRGEPMRVLRICWIGVQIVFAVAALILFVAFCPHGRR